MFNIQEKYGCLATAIRQKFTDDGFIPLHAPVFAGKEKEYLIECIDSTFVSSVGAFVDRFEAMMCEITGAKYAIATMNGTAALHMCLILAGVQDGDEVITQPLTFVATCNALTYQRAHPVFIDVDRDTMGLSPDALEAFLDTHGEIRDGRCFNKQTGRRITAVVPMHTFGIAAKIERLLEICERWHLVLIEDAAEALGSYSQGRHLGTIGHMGAFSFNGNKIVTSGGGGCIVTNCPDIAKLAKHLTTTAKVPHAWEFFHDQVGYNYRLPNVNAALACAQLEQLQGFMDVKRKLADFYADVCAQNQLQFVQEPAGTQSNYWLNAILVDDPAERDALLQWAAEQKIMMRPIWRLMNELPAFANAQSAACPNAEWLQSRIVNLPSSASCQ